MKELVTKEQVSGHEKEAQLEYESETLITKEKLMECEMESGLG